MLPPRSLLFEGGGIAGFAKKRSKPSLISGVSAGALTAVLAYRPTEFVKSHRYPCAGTLSVWEPVSCNDSDV